MLTRRVANIFPTLGLFGLEVRGQRWPNDLIDPRIKLDKAACCCHSLLGAFVTTRADSRLQKRSASLTRFSYDGEEERQLNEGESQSLL